MPPPPRVLRAAADGRARRGGRARRARPARPGVRTGRRCLAAAAERVTRSGARATARGAGLERHRAADAEKEALGLFWTGHPIDAHAADLRSSARGPSPTCVAATTVESSADDGRGAAGAVPAARGGEESRSAASSRDCRPLKTRKGDPMAVCTLEDRAWQRRGRRLPRDVQAGAAAGRERRDGPGDSGSWSATTRRCAILAIESARRWAWSASGWRTSSRSRSACRRTAARRSRRWPKSVRRHQGRQAGHVPAAVQGQGRPSCACARRCRRISASGRRRCWSSRWRGSAAPAPCAALRWTPSAIRIRNPQSAIS